MNSSNPFRSIALTDIRLEDDRFRITVEEEEDLTSLIRSIRTVGLICPPTVWLTDSGFIPVCGFRRIQAARSLAEAGASGEIDCRIMPSDQEKACALQAVADNAFARELTPSEQVRAVRLLGRFMNSAQMARQSPGIFNRQLNPAFISELLAVSDLPPKAIALLENGRLALKPARRLTGYDSGAIEVLIDLFSRIKASSGKQLDMITCFTEVCKKERIAPATLFNETGLQALFKRDIQDLGQKGDQIRQYLVHRRFPNLEQARQKARSHVGRLQSQNGFRFHLPDNFESMTYGVSFEFTSSEEFRNQVQSLTSLADHPDLKGLLQR